ncbi:MAG: hypothetical protein Q8M31_14775 [Beijerinckiaceae bacterium]|nr:hypothetical protein [Beijerinckiaceae bacterium]
MVRTLLLVVIGLSIVTPAVGREETQAKGVNPAEIDTRIDLIPKYIWLKGGGGIFTTTLKLDYKISDEFGFNIEAPVIGHARIPAAGLTDTGVGDVFARLRYVHSMGRLSIGGAIETVLPTASHRTLGSGAFQLNLAGLVVYAWSPTVITAFVGKAVQSVHEQSGRTQVQENTARAIQAFILPHGRFLTFDVRYNWETVNRQDRWWEAQVEAGAMLNAQTALSVSFSRKFGDREDRGAISTTLKRFF